MRHLYGYSNISALALAYVLIIVAPSWVAVMNAIGWTAAWYYHYAASKFIAELIEDGVISG